jgi:hypothetical protein
MKMLIKDTVENDDETVTLTVDLDEELEQEVIQIGLQLMFTCAAYNLDVADVIKRIPEFAKEEV